MCGDGWLTRRGSKSRLSLARHTQEPSPSRPPQELSAGGGPLGNRHATSRGRSAAGCGPCQPQVMAVCAGSIRPSASASISSPLLQLRVPRGAAPTALPRPGPYLSATGTRTDLITHLVFGCPAPALVGSSASSPRCTDRCLSAAPPHRRCVVPLQRLLVSLSSFFRVTGPQPGAVW